MSQCVADYADRIKDVEALLANHPNELKFYQSLTPGYQKDWARNLFSVKQEKTREKRLEKMIEILSQGYKTIELFRKKKKIMIKEVTMLQQLIVMSTLKKSIPSIILRNVLIFI